MGGHNAWRKRVKRGELAKQGGGAICRHRPRLGRRGKDLILNRKGHILGGPNKKKTRNRNSRNHGKKREYDKDAEGSKVRSSGSDAHVAHTDDDADNREVVNSNSKKGDSDPVSKIKFAIGVAVLAITVMHVMRAKDGTF